jgi:hypothetical protein
LLYKTHNSRCFVIPNVVKFDLLLFRCPCVTSTTEKSFIFDPIGKWINIFLFHRNSDYPFGIFWPLCCLPFFSLQFLITPLVSSNFSSKVLYVLTFLLVWYFPWISDTYKT